MLAGQAPYDVQIAFVPTANPRGERGFDIEVRGGYHEIAAFLGSVAALPRIVTLHDFTLTPVNEGDTLRLSLLARTYSYREDADPKARAGNPEGGDD